MKKNNLIIKQQKRLMENIRDLTPKVYAAIAISLFEFHKWDADQIEELFAESQEIWNQSIEKGIDMKKWCSDITDIDLVAVVNDKAKPGI